MTSPSPFDKFDPYSSVSLAAYLVAHGVHFDKVTVSGAAEDVAVALPDGGHVVVWPTGVNTLDFRVYSDAGYVIREDGGVARPVLDTVAVLAAGR